MRAFAKTGVLLLFPPHIQFVTIAERIGRILLIAFANRGHLGISLSSAVGGYRLVGPRRLARVTRGCALLFWALGRLVAWSVGCA